MSMNKIRQQVEREIATTFVDAALADGYTIQVSPGDEGAVSTPTRERILAEMFQCDEDRLWLHKNKKRSWAYFVYGNDGWDVLSDYTTDLEHIMPIVNAAIEKYEDL